MARWLVVIAFVGCRSHEPQPRARVTPPPADTIPRATSAITIDGEWIEPDWSARALRGQFRGSDGQLARPSSELRLLHDDHDVLVALYAADENIETRDAFDLTIDTLALHVTATAEVTPATPGIRAKVDYDEGTRDDAHDDDEEWVVELAIPLSLVAAPRHTISASRCDTPKDGVQRCATWAGSAATE